MRRQLTTRAAAILVLVCCAVSLFTLPAQARPIPPLTEDEPPIYAPDTGDAILSDALKRGEWCVIPPLPSCAAGVGAVNWVLMAGVCCVGLVGLRGGRRR